MANAQTPPWSAHADVFIWATGLNFSMHGSRGGQGVRTPLKIHENIWVVSNTGTGPLNNHKATRPAFNIGPCGVHENTCNDKIKTFLRHT